MESIAVTRPQTGVLSQEQLMLSPFGALAQALSEELLARAERVEGQWPFVPLDFLEEGPLVQPPAAAPVYQVDLHLVLETLRREKDESGQHAAVERIVERVIQLREARPAPPHRGAPLPARRGEGAALGSLTQNFYQLLCQENRFLPLPGHLPRPDTAVEWGRAAAGPWQAAPGGLGRRAADFASWIQRMREDGAGLSQGAAGQAGRAAGGLTRARRLEQTAAPDGLDYLEEPIREPRGDTSYPAAQLRRAAELAVEDVLDHTFDRLSGRRLGGGMHASGRDVHTAAGKDTQVPAAGHQAVQDAAALAGREPEHLPGVELSHREAGIPEAENRRGQKAAPAGTAASQNLEDQPSPADGAAGGSRAPADRGIEAAWLSRNRGLPASARDIRAAGEPAGRIPMAEPTEGQMVPTPEKGKGLQMSGVALFHWEMEPLEGEAVRAGKAAPPDRERADQSTPDGDTSMRAGTGAGSAGAAYHPLLDDRPPTLARDIRTLGGRGGRPSAEKRLTGQAAPAQERGIPLHVTGVDLTHRDMEALGGEAGSRGKGRAAGMESEGEAAL